MYPSLPAVLSGPGGGPGVGEGSVPKVTGSEVCMGIKGNDRGKQAGNEAVFVYTYTCFSIIWVINAPSETHITKKSWKSTYSVVLYY